jgi:hypothetical protein
MSKIVVEDDRSEILIAARKTSSVSGIIERSARNKFHRIGEAGSPVSMPINALNWVDCMPPCFTKYTMRSYNILS